MDSLIKVLYHHPNVTPEIVFMISGRLFDTPPPEPTEKEKQDGKEVVEQAVKEYFHYIRAALLEVTGEDIFEKEV